MRTSLIVALLCWASVMPAVNVQVGFSSYNHQLAGLIAANDCRSHSSPWQGMTTRIGGLGGGSHLEVYTSQHGVWLREKYKTLAGISGETGVLAAWEDRDNPLRITLLPSGLYSNPAKIDVAEVVRCPTFGQATSASDDHRFEHGVLTMRGDPCSIVMNDTGEDRLVNGVLIRAGEAARLPFPFWLRMDKVDGIRFFDLTTGEEFSPQDFSGNEHLGLDYINGAYAPMWTGDFRFTDGTKRQVATSGTNQLLFADIATSSGNLAYSTNGMPLYASSVRIATNIQLNTWWEFSTADWGNSPNALLNDSVVCKGHSSSHIIPYSVNADGIRASGSTGIAHVYFTMSQTPQENYPGGSCVMRCWDAAGGADASGYANTLAGHKAEVSAGSGVARFRLSINTLTGEWKVEPN